MKSIIQFTISQGDKYFIASGVDFPVVTQGKTLDELYKNIKEAVSLHLAGKNPSSFGLNKKPSVLINMEVPLYA